jgi:hypothetical protein
MATPIQIIDQLRTERDALEAAIMAIVAAARGGDIEETQAAIHAAHELVLS